LEAEAVACPACQTPHHHDCWTENGGCTVFGCAQAPTDDPKIAVSTQELAQSGGARNYFVSRNGEQSGPYTLEALREETYRGTIGRHELVWTAGFTNWVPLPLVLGTTQPAARAPAPSIPPLRPIAVRVDPCPGRWRFGRGLYLLSVLAAMILYGALATSPGTEGLAWLLLLGIGLTAAVLRARDVGMSGWSALLLFVPIANLIMHFRLMVAPRGYALTNLTDRTARILTWVYCGALALMFIVFCFKA
jgi:uncharacterized membrane protein YhaH (DUF805 family)